LSHQWSFATQAGESPVFSGYSALACRQDLWAVAILFNLQTLVITAAEPELTKRCSKKKNPFPDQPQREP
jgi:hypothetical protein